MNVIRPVSGLLAASFLSACASVDIQEYQADETTKQGASGLPYYMPRPYIVAVLLPADGTGTGSTVPTVQAQPNRQAPVMPANPPAHNPAPPPNVVAPTPRAGGVPVHASAPAPAPAAQPAPATDSSQTAKAAAPSSGATETQDGGLQFSNSRYLLRIIQLQDYSRPVRINVRPGLFGTASISPQLTGGWRLNGLSASADQTAFATLLGTIVSTAGTAAKGLAGAAVAGGAPTGQPAAGLGLGVLEPGLYKIMFHKKTGEPAGLCKVALFGPPPADGSAAPAAADDCVDPE